MASEVLKDFFDVWFFFLFFFIKTNIFKIPPISGLVSQQIFNENKDLLLI